MSALRAIEAPVSTDAAGPASAKLRALPDRRHAGRGGDWARPAVSAAPSGDAEPLQPRSSSMNAAQQTAASRAPFGGSPDLSWPVAGAPRAAGSPTVARPAGAAAAPKPVIQSRRPGPAGQDRAPVRLTRRGRMLLSGLVLAVLTGAALAACLLISGGAQATNHGQPRAGYQGLHQVVVEPGQTLWSIALAAEPTANTGDVVEQIITVNALSGSVIRAGQLLWVP
jgi:LysM domain